MNVQHVTLSPERFECKRCGTSHSFLTKLYGHDYERKANLFMAQHADCNGVVQHRAPMPFRPAAPPTKATIIC